MRHQNPYSIKSNVCFYLKNLRKTTFMARIQLKIRSAKKPYLLYSDQTEKKREDFDSLFPPVPLNPKYLEKK